MAANTSPIYTRRGTLTSVATIQLLAPVITTGGDVYDGVTVAPTPIFQSDTTEGSYLQRLRFKAKGTNVATVARVYINVDSVSEFLIGEVTLPATTSSTTQALPDIDYPINMALPLGAVVSVALSTTVANGWYVLGVGGDY